MLSVDYCKERLEDIDRELKIAKARDIEYMEPYIRQLKRLRMAYQTELSEAIKREPKPIAMMYEDRFRNREKHYDKHRR